MNTPTTRYLKNLATVSFLTFLLRIKKYAAVLPIDGLDVFKHGLRVYFTFSYGGASGISAEFLAEFPGADAFRAKYETDKVHYSAFMDHETPWKDVPKQFRSLIGSNGSALIFPYFLR